MRGDITKLPKWAQAEIQRLKRNEASYLAKLSAGPEDSDTFADPDSAALRPLGRGTTIEFSMGDDRFDRIRIRTAQDKDGTIWLDVNGGDGIIVRPRASNAIEIRTGRK